MIPPLPAADVAFEPGHGFPRPRWDALWQWVDEHVAEADRHEAACALERAWFDRLARHLGGAYAVAESDNFLLLSEPGMVEACKFLEMAETTLRFVEDALEDARQTGAFGKVPVIVFTEDDDFYDYLSQFFGEGNYGRFAGVCVREGDVHIALRCPEDWTRRTFAHELGHACLAHLSLPEWLEEGVVEVVTRRVVDEDPLHLNAVTRVRHYAFWSWHGLTAFWSGTSFGRPDELQHLSYELAEALVRLLNAQDPARFNEFLLAADRADAGEAACGEFFGRSLVAVVAKLLGEGPWIPPTNSAGDTGA